VRKFVGMLLLGGLVAGLSAIPAAAGEGNLKKFCKTNVAIDASEEGPSDRLLERLGNTAPPEIADTVDSAVSAFQEQGEAVFEDPTFVDAIAEIDQFVLDNCDYEQVDVTMEDYSFTGIPDEVEAGTIAFSLTNDGAELHEFVVFQLRGDATLDDLLELPEDATEEDFGEFVKPVPGGGFAEPGASDLALVKLNKDGNYVALCFIPVGSTDEASAEAAEEAGAPPHFMEGMAAEFEVTS
jgi:hypothetical protein